MPPPTLRARQPVYLISRVGDVLFGMVIGMGAAAMRVRREELEQGRRLDETAAAAQRRLLGLIGR
jgi:hypothetical protein